MAKQNPEIELLIALRAARDEAAELLASEIGQVERDGKVEEFLYAPFYEVQAEVHRLEARFGLLFWTDHVKVERVAEYTLGFTGKYTLLHVSSGVGKSFEYSGMCHPLSEYGNKAPHAIEATSQYAWRCAAIKVFGIRIKRKPAALVAAPPVVRPRVQPAGEMPSYTIERLLDQLAIWRDHQAEIEKAESGRITISGGGMEEAWAACRRSAKDAGITIRPLMPGDKPSGETEYTELYAFLYAENFRDGLVK